MESDNLYCIKIYPSKRGYWALLEEWGSYSNKPLKKYCIIEEQLVEYSESLLPIAFKKLEACREYTEKYLANKPAVWVKWVKIQKKWKVVLEKPNSPNMTIYLGQLVEDGDKWDLFPDIESGKPYLKNIIISDDLSPDFFKKHQLTVMMTIIISVTLIALFSLYAIFTKCLI